MQNLVVFIEQSKDASNISENAGILYLNRFCIDEDAACELSGVYYLNSEETLDFTLKEKALGKANKVISKFIFANKNFLLTTPVVQLTQ